VRNARAAATRRIIIADAAIHAVGKRFGGYEIRAFLGQHGGTQVYQATQLNLQRTVRLTVLPSSAARKPAHRISFERELEAVAQLGHDNILGAIEAGEIDGHRYVVTEDIAGRTLADALDGGREFTTDESVRIARDIVAGLERLEREGFTHRHITPKSIVLTDAGVVKIAGLARAKRQEQGAGETWFDSEDEDVHYRSPESLRGKGRLDIRADVYGLGCVLYQLLAGRPPFLGPGAVVLTAHLESRPESIRKRNPSVPASLENVVMNCLEKSRADRYQHAAELLRDLDALRAGTDVKALGDPAAKKPRGIKLLRSRRRRR